MIFNGYFAERLRDATACLKWANEMGQQNVLKLASYNMANAVPKSSFLGRECDYRSIGRSLAQEPDLFFMSPGSITAEWNERNSKSSVGQDWIKQGVQAVDRAITVVLKAKEAFNKGEPFNKMLGNISTYLRELRAGYQEGKASCQ